jgi:hypothetical protein
MRQAGKEFFIGSVHKGVNTMKQQQEKALLT